MAMAAGFAAVVSGFLHKAVVPGFLHKVGVLPSVSKALIVAYDNAWFASFFVADAVYCLLCRRRDGEVK
jgi:NCS1 family nucleobase:cation symporter-1